MIFSKRLSEITYEDCKTFITQNIRESINLDYKEDFSGTLPKTICAFANTFGGIVIIGIKDNDGFPDQVSDGIKYTDGLSERVTRIVTDNIYPPLTPEVWVSRNGDKCFVLIRVAEQIDTPYTVKHNRPYVRTGDVKTPDDLATLEKVEWLNNRRTKADTLRSKILEGMAVRCQNNEKLKKLQIPFGIATLTIGPSFPYLPLFTESDMLDIRNKIVVQGYGAGFPDGSQTLRTVQGGVSYLEFIESTSDFQYVEINQHGFILFKKDFGLRQLNEKKEVQSESFQLGRFVMYLDLFIETGIRLCAIGGHIGSIKLTVSIEQVLGTQINPKFDARTYYSGYPVSVDSELQWELVIKAEELSDKDMILEKKTDLCSSIYHAFNIPGIRENIKKLLSENGPYKHTNQ